MKAFFASVLLLLFFLPSAMAEIEVEITPNEATTIPGGIASYIISLKNTQSFEDMISIAVSSDHLD